MALTTTETLRAAPAPSPLSETPGVVAVPTSEIGRFMLFTMSLAGTTQPYGSRIHAAASANVVENLNTIIREMLPGEGWVWILGDDHVWPNDTLQVLLGEMDAHPEIDILVPLVVKRNPPWVPVLYHRLDEFDEDGIQLLRTYGFDEIPPSGVFEVDAAGSAGMLIRRETLDLMGDPWFHSTPDTQGRSVTMNEDVTFCLHARELGQRVFATTAATMGHLGIFNVRPVRHPDTRKWVALTEFSSPDEQFRHLFMPLGPEEEQRA